MKFCPSLFRLSKLKIFPQKLQNVWQAKRVTPNNIARLNDKYTDINKNSKTKIFFSFRIFPLVYLKKKRWGYGKVKPWRHPNLVKKSGTNWRGSSFVINWREVHGKLLRQNLRPHQKLIQKNLQGPKGMF